MRVQRVYARVLEAPNHEPASELVGHAMAGDDPPQFSLPTVAPRG